VINDLLHNLNISRLLLFVTCFVFSLGQLHYRFLLFPTEGQCILVIFFILTKEISFNNYSFLQSDL